MPNLRTIMCCHFALALLSTAFAHAQARHTLIDRELPFAAAAALTQRLGQLGFEGVTVRFGTRRAWGDDALVVAFVSKADSVGESDLLFQALARARPLENVRFLAIESTEAPDQKLLTRKVFWQDPWTGWTPIEGEVEDYFRAQLQKLTAASSPSDIARRVVLNHSLSQIAAATTNAAASDLHLNSALADYQNPSVVPLIPASNARNLLLVAMYHFAYHQDWTEFDRSLPKLELALKSLGKPVAPKSVFKVSPTFPVRARQYGRTGWVLLSFKIDKTGRTVDHEIVEASKRHIFDRAARDALSKYRYIPAFSGREFVARQRRLRVTFELLRVDLPIR